MSAKPPGTQRTCNCLTFLELLSAFPDGPFAESFLPDGGSGVLIGYMHVDWPWCPGCGGRWGKFSPELKAAQTAFQTAAAGPYKAVVAVDTMEEVRALCSQLGALETDSGPYHAEFWERSASLPEYAGWDPEHERIYSKLSFSPQLRLLRSPFVSGTVSRSG